MMKRLETDLETLENAMIGFFRTMKRPQHWRLVTDRARITIDRPAAGILKAIMACPVPCRVQDLANMLSVEAPTVTRKTQELERAGYLRRVPDKDDRRATDLYITARGRSAAKKLWNSQRAIMANVLQDWNPAERQQFVQLFEKFSIELADAIPKTHHSTHQHQRGDTRV